MNKWYFRNLFILTIPLSFIDREEEFVVEGKSSNSSGSAVELLKFCSLELNDVNEMFFAGTKSPW